MSENRLFACALRAQPRYRLGEPITVTFEIRNASSQHYCILTWGTPLEASPLNFLSVSREGSEVPYDGPLVKRGDPLEDDYIILAPGEYRSAEVDVSQLYAIQLPGDYTATLQAELADAYPISGGVAATARVRASHKRQALEEVGVTLTVEAGDPPRMTLGQAARLAESANEPPGRLTREPFMPWLVGGNPAQQADVRAAHAHAVFKVAKSLDVLQYFGPGNAHYRRWFGANVAFDPVFSPGLMTYNVIVTSFGQVRGIMNFPTFPVQTYQLDGGPQCTPSIFGYTFGGSRTIYLCQLFWDADLYEVPDAKFGALIHEWSHAAAYTGDLAIGTPACLSLATTNPRGAAINADNFEYFAEFL